MHNHSFQDYVLDQLRTLNVRAKPMFGGHGLDQDRVFFGILHRGKLYFRTNMASRVQYVQRGMTPFLPPFPPDPDLLL